MPTSVLSYRAAGTSWLAYLIPLVVIMSAAALTFLLHRRFEAALEVLAPTVVGLCVVAAAAGLLQLHVLSRRARRRARSYPEVSRVIDVLAAGNQADGLAQIGRSWRTLDAARGMAAARSPQEQQLIRAGRPVATRHRPAARRATSAHRKWERVRAMHDLGWLAVPEAMGIVSRGLRAHDDDIAWSAIVALGGMEEDIAYDILLDLLEDGRFAASRIAQVLDTSRHPRPLLSLRARLGRSRPGTLFWVAYLLGRSGDDDALESLLELARDADANVRASAAEGLGGLGRTAAEGALIRLMQDDAWFVRLHACRALGDLATARGTRPLQAATGDPVWFVRRSALDALRRTGEAAL